MIGALRRGKCNVAAAYREEGREGSAHWGREVMGGVMVSESPEVPDHALRVAKS